MTKLIINGYIVNVFISKNERINIGTLKLLLGKGRRMIQQNNATSVLIQLENASRIDKDALAFFNRVLCYNSSFPVAIINNG